MNSKKAVKATPRVGVTGTGPLILAPIIASTIARDSGALSHPNPWLESLVMVMALWLWYY